MTMLSDRTLELLRGIQIPAMLIPKAMGGLGMFPRDALAVLERLAQIDSSIGWVGGNWSAVGSLIGFLGKDAGLRLLGDGQPYIGASGAPTGRAVPVEGGYRETGRWSYGSGDLHAKYIMVTAVQVGENGAPVMQPNGMPSMPVYIIDVKDVSFHGNLAGCQHFIASDAIYPDVARELVGLAPEHVVWSITGLAEVQVH